MEEKTTSREDKLRSQYRLRTIRIAPRWPSRPEPSANESQKGKTPLGEVRVKVKLTNAGDEVMVRRGLLSADKVRHYEADARVDTGAVRSVLPAHIVQQLGLAIVGKARAVYVNDGAEEVDIAEVVGIDIDGRRTTEETLVLGSEVLIGQTVLESLDLHVDCTNQRVMGNPAHPDQPMIKIKRLGRNELTRGRSFIITGALPTRKYMSEQEPSTYRPFAFTVIEDDGVNVTIEVSEEDYKADLAAGIDEEATMKPGRYIFKRGGFLARHPELKLEEKKRA